MLHACSGGRAALQIDYVKRKGDGRMAQDQMITVETLKQFLGAFNRHDLDAIMEFFAEDCSMDLPRGPHPWGRRLTGVEQVREGCAGRFAGLPDAHYGQDRHWVSGNMGFSEWTLTGTTPSGERVEVRGTDHVEFREGKIVRKDSYWKIVEG
jgi:ketosteroid isomerase-like protein